MNLYELWRLGFLWTPDEGSGGGSSAPTPAAEQGGDDDGAKAKADQAGESDQGGGGGEGDEPKHQISQSDLTKRLERARAEAVNKLLKELGVDKAEDLKAIIDAEKARREGELTELQKTQRQLEAVTKERDELKSRYEALLEDVHEERVKAAISAAARHAKHPEDVIAWAKANAADELASIINDEGVVDEAKAKAVVAKCQKARPEWFNASTPGVPSNAGAHGPTDAEQVKKISEIAARQARSFF